MRRTKVAEQVKARAVVRCAIYTRKSTEEGLEQEFNSLDAQREAAEAYVKSQAHEGWICLPERYDDGGFTGGNMDRPAVQRVLADIEQGKVDAVITYKVDPCARRLWPWIDALGRSAVEVAEGFADGLAGPDELRAARLACQGP